MSCFTEGKKKLNFFRKWTFFKKMSGHYHAPSNLLKATSSKYIHKKIEKRSVRTKTRPFIATFYAITLKDMLSCLKQSQWHIHLHELTQISNTIFWNNCISLSVMLIVKTFPLPCDWKLSCDFRSSFNI